MSDCYCGDRSQLDLFHSPEGCVSRSSTAVSQPWIERSQLPLCARCGHGRTAHYDDGCPCGCRQYTAVDNPVDGGVTYTAVGEPVDGGVTLQPALDEFIRRAVYDRVTRDPHYLGTRLPTPAEVEAEAQEQLRRRKPSYHYGFSPVPPSPLEEIAGVVSDIHAALAAIEARLTDLESRADYHDTYHPRD